MGADLAQQIQVVAAQRDACYPRVVEVLIEVGEHYKARGLAQYEINQGHDVHAFYRLSADPRMVVHVQGYPGLSSDEEMLVAARMMNYTEMMEIRGSGRFSVGNEHEATIRWLFEPMQISLPYSAEALETKLAESVPELR